MDQMAQLVRIEITTVPKRNICFAKIVQIFQDPGVVAHKPVQRMGVWHRDHYFSSRLEKTSISPQYFGGTFYVLEHKSHFDHIEALPCVELLEIRLGQMHMARKVYLFLKEVNNLLRSLDDLVTMQPSDQAFDHASHDKAMTDAQAKEVDGRHVRRTTEDLLQACAQKRDVIVVIRAARHVR